jgi:FdhD protein
METVQELNILRIQAEAQKTIKETVTKEKPFTILVNGEELVTLLCTPKDLEALAIGFLLSQGLVVNKGDVREILLGQRGEYVNVELKKSRPISSFIMGKRIIGSGCGKEISFYDTRDVLNSQPITSQIKVRVREIFSLMKEFHQTSHLFKLTGGVHSAALSEGENIEVFAEDIGRHNAIDKILGKCFLDNIPLEDKIILTTGRVTSEIVVKIIRQKIPIIISQSAPTDLALSFAEKMKVTLIGFVRGTRMNIYTHKFRIT